VEPPGGQSPGACACRACSTITNWAPSPSSAANAEPEAAANAVTVSPIVPAAILASGIQFGNFEDVPSTDDWNVGGEHYFSVSGLGDKFLLRC
jgi:hypothetical protein